MSERKRDMQGHADEPVRGVNLGGWLITEPWMTPSLYEGTGARDEYGLARTPGGPERLRRHRETFIGEEDFAWLAAHGVRFVRIPVGFWLFDGAGPLPPCAERLDWAFEAAQRHGVRILVCLHGAPGSQNGQDHSGRIGPPMWYARSRHRAATLDVLERIARRYAGSPAWWGIELLNEPLPFVRPWALRGFCRSAHERLREPIAGRGRLAYSDAFTPRFTARLMSRALRPDPDGAAIMDVHWYHFTFWLHRIVPLRSYMHRVLPARERLLRRLRARGTRVMIGEWSAVIAGPVLERLPAGLREGATRHHLRAQLRAYGAADAWFYWSYRTEEEGYWNFRWLVERGWFDGVPGAQQQ